MLPETSSAPFAAPFSAPTGVRVILDKQGPPREVFIPSEEAKAWDGAQEGTNCTILSPRFGVHFYAELRITGRVRRKVAGFGGVVGLKARVRFTSDASEPGWHDAVVWTGEPNAR